MIFLSIQPVLSRIHAIPMISSLCKSFFAPVTGNYHPITTPLPIPSHLRFDLGVIWEPTDGWEIGFFGQDLLDPHH